MDNLEQCALCFGRGYRGGDCKTCRRCRGLGSVEKGSHNPDPWGWDEEKGCTTYNGKLVGVDRSGKYHGSPW